MKVSGVVPVMMMMAFCASVQAAEAEKTVSFQEVAPPDPVRSPAPNEQRTVRPGDVVYTERATGLPGARLAEPLTLKNTPAGHPVTIGGDDPLPKFLVDGAPWFCALYVHKHGWSRRLEVRRADLFPVMAGDVDEGERKEAGFYVCMRDGDGQAGTFEQVRMVTLTLEALKRKRVRYDVTVSFQRIYEIAASGTLPPKKFSETTVDPDYGDYFEAVIRLTKLENGTAEFRSELLDMDGDRELRPKRTNVDLSGPFPRTVAIPHPFSGDTVYVRGGSSEPDERAAQLEILAVDGNQITYRMLRSWQPWRYWSEGPARRPEKRLRWRPRS